MPWYVQRKPRSSLFRRGEWLLGPPRLCPDRHVLPDAPRIDDVEVPSLSERHHLEFIMVHEKDCDLAASQRLVDRHESHVVLGKFGGQCSKVRLHDVDARFVFGSEM